MRAGWSTALDDYITRSNFDMTDFIPSTVDAMVYEGVTYGIPFLAESTEMIYRRDKLDEAGIDSYPKTFDELETVLEAIHAPEEFYSYVMRTEPNGVHFPFPIWLQGYGGNVFRDPPNDLTPTLNTAEALAATDDFTGKIMRYSIAGSQIYGTPDCQNVMAQGKAGIWVDALGHLLAHHQPGDEQGGGPGGDRAAARRTGRPVPADRHPRPADSGRFEEEGRGVGIHRLGHEPGVHVPGHDGGRLQRGQPQVDPDLAGIRRASSTKAKPTSASW